MDVPVFDANDCAGLSGRTKLLLQKPGLGTRSPCPSSLLLLGQLALPKPGELAVS